MQQILVETEKIGLTTLASNPVRTYLAASNVLGPENTFLLESASGPARDNRQSIVGLTALATIEVRGQEVTVRADAPLMGAMTRALGDVLGGRPVENGRVVARTPGEVWMALRTLNDLFSLSGQEEGFVFGYFGYFGYDIAWLIEQLPRHIEEGDDLPPISLALFQSYFIFEKGVEPQLVVNRAAVFPDPPIESYLRLIELSEAISMVDDKGPAPTSETNFTVERTRFLRNARKALEHIRIGDIYQIQIGHEIKVQSPMSPVELYCRLRRLNPSPYMFLCNLNGVWLIGSSPELYVGVRDGQIVMRPIAGTVGKGSGKDLAARIEELKNSPKEVAEHVMLVDLCRNDIGRVCSRDTLEVTSLMEIEEYSHLYHMVSNVIGGLKADHDIFDVIKATFPAGTMTGAPKIRAIEIIEEMETSRRGVYAGAIGVIGPNGVASTALCIRMATYRQGQFTLRASAGIVAESDPESEWRETLLKMTAVYKSITDRELVR